MEEQNISASKSTTRKITRRLIVALKTLKENAPYVVAVTTILGGINQFYNLTKIGKYYVRFFSLTQLISDGIWIIYLLLPLYISAIFLIPFTVESDIFLELFNPIDKNKNYKRHRAIILNSSLIVFIYGFCFLSIYNNGWKYASLVLLLYSFVGFRANFWLLKKYKNEDMFFYFGAISFTVFVASIYFASLRIFRDNDIPKNLENNKLVNQIIEENYPDYKYKLLYMNDKYIFSKIYCDSITEPGVKVLLLPSEEFLKIHNLSKKN